MEINIELLSIQELDGFWEVFSSVIQNDFPGYSRAVISHFLTKAYTKSTYHYWLTTNWKIIYVAKTGQKIVGFAVIDKPYGGVCFCRWLGVLAGFRHQDIGKKLIDIWLAYAKSYGCHKVELAAQLNAKAFYEKCGLVLEGERKLSYFGIDQPIFGKVLGQPNDETMVRE